MPAATNAHWQVSILAPAHLVDHKAGTSVFMCGRCGALPAFRRVWPLCSCIGRMDSAMQTSLPLIGLKTHNGLLLSPKTCLPGRNYLLHQSSCPLNSRMSNVPPVCPPAELLLNIVSQLTRTAVLLDRIFKTEDCTIKMRDSLNGWSQYLSTTKIVLPQPQWMAKLLKAS